MGQRDTNAIVVDISARMSALRQARARHSAAVNTRTLQEQLLAADREKFASGIATFNDIINDQRALVAAQISEVNALAAYAHARVSLDQTVGETLERNHVSLEEGLSGRVARGSKAPEGGEPSERGGGVGGGGWGGVHNDRGWGRGEGIGELGAAPRCIRWSRNGH